VLSQLRVICVWVPSVLFLGGVVNALELVGFAVLTFGVLMYKNMVLLPSVCYPPPPPPPPQHEEDGGGYGATASVPAAMDTEMRPAALDDDTSVVEADLQDSFSQSMLRSGLVPTPRATTPQAHSAAMSLLTPRSRSEGRH